MVKRALRMTCSAQMHTELDARYWILDTRSPRDSLRRTKDENRASRIEHRVRGFTLTELVVVILVVSMFVLLAQMHTNIADSGQQTADRKRKLYAKRCTLNADSGFTLTE